MKSHISIVTLIASASLALGVTESPSPSPTPRLSPTATPSGPRCQQMSWSPELYGFYGKKQTVIDKLAQIPTPISEHRIVVQITQGDATGDVRLFEQQKDGTFTVTQWATRQSSDILAGIDKTIMDNKGRDCVGAAIKDLLTEKLGQGKALEPLAAPGSSKDAFSPSIQSASGDFIKTVIFFGC